MQQNIKFKNKIIARLSFHIDYRVDLNKKQIILSLIKDIQDSRNGYAGFKTRQAFHAYLVQTIFDSSHKEKIMPPCYNQERIVRIIKNSIIECHKVLPVKKSLDIFIFPTFSEFVKKKMHGTAGHTPWKNTCLIFIHPSNKWQKNTLTKTIAHEYCHAVALNYHSWTTLLDSFIFEGIAEHFSERIVSCPPSPWAEVLSKEQSRKLLMALQKCLSSKNHRLYQRIFFGNGKYPLWSGYTIGYHIISSFFQKNPGVNWEQIVALSPKVILKRSGFI